MKNKKVFIILGIIVTLVILALVLFLILRKHKTIEISFDTDGAGEVESIKVEKGRSITLPSVTKEGFTFLGWYIGDIKVNDSTKYAENTTVVAKWLDESIKKYTIKFDTDGGSNVDDLVVECGKELKLPINPTKTGYDFISWVDKNETPILDKALLACEDITLKANWKKDEVVEKKEEKKDTKKNTKKETKTNYTCSEGTLNVDKCIIEGTLYNGCPDNSKDAGDVCIILTDYTEGTRECGEKIVNMGGGSTPKVKGIKVDSGTTFCYYGEVSDDQETCSSRQRTWSNALGKCFIDMDQNYITTCPSSYQYYSSSDILNKFGGHNNGGCYKIINKTSYCDSDFTLTDGKCLKTIDATTSN